MSSPSLQFLFELTHFRAFSVRKLVDTAIEKQSPTPVRDNYSQPYEIFSYCWSGDDSNIGRLYCALASLLGFLSSIPTLLLVLIGIPGNALAAWVLLGRARRNKDRTRQSVYLGFTSAVSSAAVLTYGFFHFFLPYGLPWMSGGSAGFVAVNVSDVACRLVSFIMTWLILLTYGLLTAMVCDRTLSMYWPFRFQRYGKDTAYRVCAIVFLATLVIATYMLASARLITNNLTGSAACVKYSFTDIGLSSFSIFYDIGLGYPPVLLIVTMLIANAALLIRVLNIRRHRQELLRLPNQTKKPNVDRMDSGVRSCTVCLVVSVGLLICSVPCTTTAVLTYTLSAKAESNLSMLEIVILVCHVSELLIIFELSISWLLLAWRSPNFRRDLLNCLGRQQGKSVSSSTGGSTANSSVTNSATKVSSSD